MKSIKNTRELIREIPKATKDNNPSGLKKNTQISPHVDLGYAKPKSAVLKENGISQRQAEHFQNVIHLLIHHDSLDDSE